MILEILATTSTDNAEQIGYYVGVAIASIIMIGSPIVFVWSLFKLCKTKEKSYIIALILSAIPTTLIIVGFSIGLLKGLERTSEYVVKDTELPADRVIQIQDTPLRIKLPEHWDTLTNLNENASFEAGNLRREEYCVVFTYNKLDISSTAETLYYTGLNELEVALNNSQIIKEEEMTLLGKTARQAEISGDVSDINLVYLDTTIEGKDHYYRILQWTLPSKRKKALSVFNEVISSIEESIDEVQNPDSLY